MSTQNIEKAITQYKEFLEVISPRIDAAVANGTSVPTTVFSKEICGQFNVEWSVVYNMIKMFVASTDDLEIGLGPKGGVRRKRSLPAVNNNAENIEQE